MLKVMKQYSIYLPNKPGELKKLLLKVKKLNLSAAATFASRDGAIMRLIPQDRGSFEAVLKQGGVAFHKDDVLLIHINDHPGGLLKILTKLQKSHVNIEGMYIVGESDGKHASCVLQPDDVRTAKAALEHGR